MKSIVVLLMWFANTSLVFAADNPTAEAIANDPRVQEHFDMWNVRPVQLNIDSPHALSDLPDQIIVGLRVRAGLIQFWSSDKPNGNKFIWFQAPVDEVTIKPDEKTSTLIIVHETRMIFKSDGPSELVKIVYTRSSLALNLASGDSAYLTTSELTTNEDGSSPHATTHTTMFVEEE